MDDHVTGVRSSCHDVEIEFGDKLTVHFNRTIAGHVFLSFSFLGDKVVCPVKLAANQVMVELKDD